MARRRTASGTPRGSTGGPHRIEITATGFASAEAVNARVPSFGSPAGIQIDAQLEEAFVLPAGITYKTYLDYSHGRTILHVVDIDVTKAPNTIGEVPQEGADFQRLLDVAVAQNAPVMTNGIWWTLAYPNENLVKKIGVNDCAVARAVI